jgi:hypothetical protein
VSSKARTALDFTQPTEDSMNKMSNLDDNMCELKEAELEAVMGGGKNECSIVFASHPDTPVEVFVAAFIKAGGTMVYSH